MVKIDISESIYTHLELIALIEGLTSAQVLDLMVKEYADTGILENRANFSAPQNRASRVAELSARRANITAIKEKLQ